MGEWLSNVVLPAAVAIAVLLLVMWPTERSGRQLLRNWGVPEPGPDQVAEAVRYLRRRRFLCAALFVLVPLLADVVLPGEDDPSIVVPLIGAMLIAELVAVSRPASGVRVASLDPRGWRDLVPRWAVVAAAVLVALVLVWSVAGLAAQPWADRYAAALSAQEADPPAGMEIDHSDSYLAEIANSTSWFALGSAVAAVVLTVLVVRLAVRRPAVADAAVDAALRTRTARVAVGIGLGWLGTAVLRATSRVQFLHDLTAFSDADLPDKPGWLAAFGNTGGIVGLVAMLSGVGCWIWVANPTRRSLSRR
jgi:hypothetical protein